MVGMTCGRLDLARESEQVGSVGCQLCGLIGEEASRLREQEGSCMIDMAQGQMLKTLVEILHSLVELPTVSAKFRREEQLPVLLHALLCVRGLVMQKTSVTADCASKLRGSTPGPIDGAATAFETPRAGSVSGCAAGAAPDHDASTSGREAGFIYVPG